MTDASLDELLEFHWMMDMLQSVDVGIVVLDRAFEIKVWNGFMESHSGMLPSDVRDKSLFELYPSIQRYWFAQKCKPVFELRTRAFMTWEQRPYLLRINSETIRITSNIELSGLSAQMTGSELLHLRL